MGRSKVFLPLLLLFQLSNFQSAIAEPTHQEESIGLSFTDLVRHISKQDIRISELEARDKKQEENISCLKATVDDDKKEILFLKNRVALLETLTENANPGDQHHYLMKRPFRLLPVSLPNNGKNSTTKVERRFYGPPTNCSELMMLGYTLNGYYLIRNNSDVGSIGIAYCQFYPQQSITEKQILETFIGNVQLVNQKKSRVHFHVLRATHLKAPVFVQFKKEIINIGKAFNMKYGIFYAPVPGLYHFLFNGIKDNSTGALDVYFSKNNKVEEVLVKTDASPMYIPIYLSTYLRLKPGDAIRVALQGGGKLYEMGQHGYSTSNSYFTGYLVEEDL